MLLTVACLVSSCCHAVEATHMTANIQQGLHCLSQTLSVAAMTHHCGFGC